ncbi:ABC transporter ATP-binding protein [Candidatus Uhrbacteria bacterium]|nr:ABC transporter ATP-binding protein [Candidatus Uhrbacteria bacterium]
MPILEMQKGDVWYGGVHALDTVDVRIEAHAITAIMGPNGAGKSTVLKGLFGLIPMRSGDIFFEGKKIIPIPHEMARRGMSCVPQGRRVFRSLTVEENISLGALHVSPLERHSRIDALYDIFPALKHKRKDQAGTLSGGQQQMLAICRGLISQPRVLLLDEPTLGLTPKFVSEIFACIQDIRLKFETTIVIVEHNLKTLFSIADYAYVLEKGRVYAQGKPDELLHTSVLQKVFLAIHE